VLDHCVLVVKKKHRLEVKVI